MVAAAQQAPGGSPDVKPEPALPGAQNGTRVFRLDPTGPFAQFDRYGNFMATIPPCPISMHVRQGSDGDMVKTRNDGQADSRFGQRIHVILDHTRIVGATVKVSGLSGRPHVTDSEPGGLRGLQPDIWRTLRVSFMPDGEASVLGSTKLVGFTSVISVRLISVTYEDGNEWTVPRTSGCSVRPDPIMLIAGR
jgi:hypothetical protein